MTILHEPHRSLPLSDFHDELRFEFPDLPAQLFDHYLIKVARQMAFDGKLIRRRAVLHGTQGVTRYRLESPDGLEICGILNIRSHPTCSCANTSVIRSFAPPEGAFNCSREVAWYDDADRMLHLAPAYCHGVYFITLAVAPAHDACELPAELHRSDTLNVGVKSHILAISSRPWTNLTLAAAYARQFTEALRSDAVEVSTHKMRGGVKMNFGHVM